MVKNAVVVAAAGNDNISESFRPANCNNVISVASIDSTDTKSNFSNYGTWVDVAAPGGFNGPTQGIYSTDFEGGYKHLVGTSMTSPHVAGLAGLVWSAGECTTNVCVVNKILTTTDPISGTGSLWQYEKINALKAVAPPATPTPLPTSTPTQTPTPTATLTPTPTRIPGDIDNNRIVNITDYNILISHIQKTGSQIPNNAIDVNRNGIVDIFDYTIVIKNFDPS